MKITIINKGSEVYFDNSVLEISNPNDLTSDMCSIASMISAYTLLQSEVTKELSDMELEFEVWLAKKKNQLVGKFTSETSKEAAVIAEDPIEYLGRKKNIIETISKLDIIKKAIVLPLEVKKDMLISLISLKTKTS